MELLTNSNAGDSILSYTSAKHAQAQASKRGIKIVTSTCLLIEDYGNKPIITKIQKITKL